MKGLVRFAGYLLFALVAHVHAQIPAPLPASEIPMYGNPDKARKLSASDAAFIASIEKAGKSRQAVAKDSLRVAWGYFQKGDHAAAIKRFNQAWLLDPENANVYHGFALISFVRDKAGAEAEKFFLLALAKPGVNVNAYVDFGRLLWIHDRLDESLVQLQKALAVSATAHNARANMAMVYFKKTDYAKACELARGARENKDIIAEDFLEEMCKRTAKG